MLQRVIVERSRSTYGAARCRVRAPRSIVEFAESRVPARRRGRVRQADRLHRGTAEVVSELVIPQPGRSIRTTTAERLNRDELPYCPAILPAEIRGRQRKSVGVQQGDDGRALQD